MQLPEEAHRIRIGIDSCAAVTVFPKNVADDFPVLHVPGMSKRYRPASVKLLSDVGARKVQVELKDRSLRYVSPRIAGTHKAFDGGVRDEQHGTRCLLSQESDRNIKAYPYDEGSGTKLELESVNGVFELPVELVPYSQCSSLSALEQIKEVMVRAPIVDHPN